MDGTFHPKYQMIGFIVRIGRPASLMIAILVLIGGVVATFLGYGWPWLVAAAVVAPIAFVVMRSYVEFAEVISDILLPK